MSDPKYQAPSGAEVRQLHVSDLSHVFRSNIFQLQIAELLQQGKWKRSVAVKEEIEKKLMALKQVVFAMSDQQQVSEECLQLGGIQLHNHIKRKEIILAFAKPSRMDLIGSYLLNTMLTPTLSSHCSITIDVAVEIPSACFLPKDFLDFRYFDKRNLYLGVLASEFLQHQNLFTRVEFAAFCGDMLKPFLVLTLKNSAKTPSKKHPNIIIHLYPVIAVDTFKLSKLIPSRSNVHIASAATEPVDVTERNATPHYNNSILEDMMMKKHMKELHDVTSACPAFVDACVLVKLWIRQQDMMESIGGFNMSMILLYLYQKKRINQQMGPELMFKVFLTFLSSDVLKSKMIMINPDDGSSIPSVSGMDLFFSKFDFVVLDSSGRLNIVARIHKNALQELQISARCALKLVSSGKIEDFQSAFIEKHNVWNKYDQYISVPAPRNISEYMYSSEDEAKISDLGLEQFWVRKLTDLYSKALGDRIFLIRPILLSKSRNEWDIKGPAPGARKLAFGLLLNREAAYREVDRCPSSEDSEESKEFKQFWGDKAELRRFKDGSIVESVVWDVLPNNKYQVFDDIIRYVSNLHVPQLRKRSKKRSCISFSNSPIFDQLNSYIPSKISYPGYVSYLWSVFGEFAKTVRSLSSLPLNVSDVLPSSTYFRYTEICPITPHPLGLSKFEKRNDFFENSEHIGRVLVPLPVVLRLEKSSRWPDSIEAIKHTRAAFFVQLANELSGKGLTSEVSFDYIDVCKSGFVFRLFLACDKELHLYRTLKAQHVLSARSSFLETTKKIVYAPTHTSLIHSLHLKNISYGPTVRYVKYWLSKQLLSTCLADEAVELLAAYCFLNSKSFREPNSVLSGFLRVLKLICCFDWEKSPLIVDLNETLTEDKRVEIKKRYDVSRSLNNHPAMYITAEYEHMDCLSSWTLGGVDKSTLNRIKSRAQNSLNFLSQWISSGVKENKWTAMLSQPLNNFDLVIYLDLDMVPSKRTCSRKSNHFAVPFYKNLTSTASTDIMYEFNPAMTLFNRLQQKFGHFALFFMNKIDCDVIAVTWRPQCFQASSFRVAQSSHMYPLSLCCSDDSSRAVGVPNMFSILSEMKEMGQGIISNIKLKLDDE